jgi:hypothetical protein
MVPVQQLLAYGIADLGNASTLGGLALLAMFIAVGAWWLDREESHRRKGVTKKQIAASYAEYELAVARGDIEPEPWQEPPRWRRWPTALAYYVLVPLMGLLLALRFVLGSRPTTLTTFVIVFPSMYWLGRVLKLRMRDRVALAFTLTFVVGVTAYGLAYPTPLPYATIVTTDGSVVVGRLLVNTDTATTVGLPDCRMRSVPSIQIRTVTVGRMPVRKVRTVGELIFEPEARKPRHSTGPCG